MLQYVGVEEKPEDSVIEMREEYTYGTKITVTKEEKISELIEECKKLIDITKEIIHS